MAINLIECNLRDMFRTLAADRPRGEVREFPGLTISAAGTEFQMFNAAFLNSPVLDRTDLERRISLAAVTFRARSLPWSFWVCEDLLAPELRRPLARVCERARLHLSSEMPAMICHDFRNTPPTPYPLEIRQVRDGSSLRDFCRIGSVAFRVPLPWFEEIFDSVARLRGSMQAWVGYHAGEAVSTSATVASAGAIGLYNLATLTPFRHRGFGEALSRHAIREAVVASGPKPVVLQSTPSGLRLYQRLGFESVGRILVFPSANFLRVPS